MLEAKEILYINATIIAGLFVLLTIVSINEPPNFDRIFEEHDEAALEHKKKYEQTMKTLLYFNSTLLNMSEKDLEIIKRLNDSESVISPKEFEEIRKYVNYTDVVLNAVDEWIAQNNQTLSNMAKEASVLNAQFEDNEKRYEEYQEEQTRLWLRTPNQWVYLLGTNFVLSAILAVVYSMTNRRQILTASHAALGGGFIMMLVIFALVGLSP